MEFRLRSATAGPAMPSTNCRTHSGIFGLSQLMANGAIRVNDGHVEQRNFDGVPPPYTREAPVAIDVHIVPSSEKPSGCGEPPISVISPAVANALFRLTGKALSIASTGIPLTFELCIIVDRLVHAFERRFDVKHA